MNRYNILSLLLTLTLFIFMSHKADAGWHIDSQPLMGGDSLIPLSQGVQEQLPDSNRCKSLIEDSPIVSVLDSLVIYTIFDKVPNEINFNQYTDPMGLSADIPKFSDSVYQARIAELQKKTPIRLVYNQHVKNFIELYGVKKRKLTSRILGLSQLYFPLFEEYLDKYGLPHELKYLAVVESALNPVAVSPAGAKGIWQFMLGTGKLYGLKCNSMIDERFDPYLATDAACRHMKDLYKIYHDWNLVMAAYNCGAGNVNKAIRRSGSNLDYWSIWGKLPHETRGYVPAFIAVYYLLNYAPEHNLTAIHPGILDKELDTVMVSSWLTLQQVASSLNISPEVVKFLNPLYKSGIIPADKNQKYVLKLPKEYIGLFINNEQQLYSLNKDIASKKVVVEVEEEVERKVHKVKKGENLGIIANKYNCTVNQIKKWNGLSGTNIMPGQRLFVSSSVKTIKKHTPEVKEPVNEMVSQTPPVADTSRTYFIHKVKKGESIRLIASSNNCTPEQIRSWNNLKSDLIHPGNELKIYTKAGKITESVAVTSNENNKTHKVVKGESLLAIAKRYGCTIEEIEKWNNLKNSTIHPDQQLVIRPTDHTALAQQPSSEADTEVMRVSHQVKTGETLSKIAASYNCSVDDLRKWNNLSSDVLMKGQHLAIEQAVVKKVETQATKPAVTEHTTQKLKPVEYVYYTVRSGDTLWDIAQKHEGVTVEQIKKLNKIKNSHSLKPGQKLKIAVKS